MPVRTYRSSKSIIHELACSLISDVCPASLGRGEAQHIEFPSRRYRGMLKRAV